jgi:hypothetical protein
MKVSITEEATTSFTLFEGMKGALVVWSVAIRYRLGCQSCNLGVSQSGSKLSIEFMLVATERQSETAPEEQGTAVIKDLPAVNRSIAQQFVNVFHKAYDHHNRGPGDAGEEHDLDDPHEEDGNQHIFIIVTPCARTT